MKSITNKSRRAKAFTLVEALVVVVICCVLAGLLWPAWNAALEASRTRQSKIEAHIEAIRGHGYRSAMAGVPATANPYAINGVESRLWLDGWIEAMEREAANKNNSEIR